MKKIEKESKIKSNNSFIWIVIIITVIIISLVGWYARARYITNLNGKLEGQVARFNFELINGIEVIENIPNLATTRNDENSKVDINLIAPDTHGVFELGINATGIDTSIVYEINMQVENKPKNLHFYSYYNENSGYSGQLDSSDGKIRLTGFMDYSETKKEVKKIYWNWEYETGETEEEIKLNDEIDSSFIGQTSLINIVARGDQGMNPKIKTASGEIVTLTKANVANYYGKEVNYIGDGENEDTANTYRLFYVDFENKYKDGAGTIYLKADNASTTSLTDYITYTSNDSSVFKNINPQWTIVDSNINNNNERATSWLADPINWTNYKKSEEYVNYAIGTPSLEMYLDSYNQYFSTNYVSKCDNIGYWYSDNEGESYSNVGTASGTISISQTMYAKGYIWLCSPLSSSTNMICAVSSETKRLYDRSYSSTLSICPIISIKSNAVLQLK